MRRDPKPYKPTMFDRHGAAAGSYMRAIAYGGMIFAIALIGGLIMMAGHMLEASIVTFLELLVVAAVFGVAVSGVSTLMASAAGATYTHLMVSGGSTPYKEQYSYQQALVMQGKVDDAIESFEAVIAEHPDAVDAHIKVAELYAREKGNAARAAELFRDAQRIPTIDIGNDVYVTNRLIDLYNGPLGEPGRALVELRRLIEKHPGSAAAEFARDALATLKPIHLKSADD